MGWLGPRSGAATCRHPEGLRTEAQHSALQPQAMWTHSRVPADAAFETTVGNCQAPPLTCSEHKISWGLSINPAGLGHVCWNPCWGGGLGAHWEGELRSPPAARSCRSVAQGEPQHRTPGVTL